MPSQYAGRFYDALFSSNGFLLKGTAFSVYVDAGASTAAVTYTNESRTTTSSSLSTDVDGNAEFYADPGTYYVKVAGSDSIRRVIVGPDVRDIAQAPIVVANQAALLALPAHEVGRGTTVVDLSGPHVWMFVGTDASSILDWESLDNEPISGGGGGQTTLTYGAFAATTYGSYTTLTYGNYA